MLLKSNFGLLLCSILAITSQQALGRENILERDGRAVHLYPRRFGQEQPAVLQKIRDACGGAVCGTLAGQAVTPLLAAQPECSQQDMADAIIDASKQFDAATAALMVAAAVEYRQVEKNTPPDFSTNPPTLRNSVFCQKAPKNPELNGLVQAQDPANDPDLFFDPALKATVRRGSQANTAPFDGVAANPPAVPQEPEETEPVLEESPAATDCVTAVTVTVTAGAAQATISDAVTVTAGTPAATTAAPPAATPATPAGADFGSCTVPEIEFGVGFDNRRETSFRPADLQSFNHGSAQNIAIITQFICDTLTNSCRANQAAKDVCAQAQTAALAATAKTGAQADAFNAVFGITTNFAGVAVVDNTGRVVSGGVDAAAPNTVVATQSAAPVAATPSSNVAGNGATGAAGAIGVFGRCTVPEIEFGAGFDGRRETSFQPADKASFNHGSAQNIDIITRSICDTLTNTCQADQTAKDTCAQAAAAASAAPAKTGGQADAFNAVFGISTNFASIAAIDDQGRVVGASTATPPPVNNGASAGNNNANNNNANNGNNNANTGNNGGAAAGGNLQTFNGNLAGVAAPVVTALGDGRFQVTGNAAFNNLRNALVRSCDVQNNQCANAANASGNRGGINVGACNAQQAQCIANANATAN
ncbi:unnamed protein product [Cyclocybe aegerita]|uniref:Uncharacterized protein n=1 Tax=Cyclocybe aegerita TaxID=1973307 RepID=A0A8S0WEL4_CYCAE|nr:unnamed protein product [Cyclocybe aegerita]